MRVKTAFEMLPLWRVEYEYTSPEGKVSRFKCSVRAPTYNEACGALHKEFGWHTDIKFLGVAPDEG